MCLIRIWSIIDDHAIDKHGDSPIIDDFCTEHIESIAITLYNIDKKTIQNSFYDPDIFHGLIFE